MEQSRNTVHLCGEMTAAPQFSHMGKNGRFFTFPLSVERLSGAKDVLNIVAPETAVARLGEEGAMLSVEGEVRSYNNRSGFGNRLLITVLARHMEYTEGDFENNVELTGTICRPPTYRRTPMGREICDLMLAVNRRYGRSDYLPCISWGMLARRSAEWSVGKRIELTGRLQSRKYIKLVENAPVEKTAFEISVITMEPADEEWI